MEIDHALERSLLLNAPFPVAFTMRRAHEVRRGDAHTRLMAVLDQVEVLLRWCAAVFLAAYRRDQFFDRSLNQTLKGSLTSPLTLGDWVYVVRNGLKCYRNAVGKRFPMPELEVAFIDRKGRPSAVARQTEQLVAARNRAVHGGFEEGTRVEEAIREVSQGLTAVAAELRPFLDGYLPVYVQAGTENEPEVVPLVGAWNDFFVQPHYLPGELDWPDAAGQTLLVTARDRRAVLALDPFCTLLPGKRFALLARARPAESEAGYRLCVRTFCPAEEVWLSDEVLGQAPALVAALRQTFEEFRRRTREVSAADIRQTALGRLFPSLVDEMIERRRLFVGREDEMRRVREWMDQLESDTDAKPLLVAIGGTGIGKTALLANVALDVGAVFHSVAAVEGRNRLPAVFASLQSQILERYHLDYLKPADAEDAAASAGQLANLLQIVSAAATAGARPLVLVIDNLDGFDDGGRELLETFPLPLPLRVGLILSARETPRSRRLTRAWTLVLSDLKRSAVAELVCALTGQDRNDKVDALADKLLQVSGGNPLFLHMLLRDPHVLAQRDQIEGAGDVFRVLIEKFDGRTDEDAYESFLALLSVARLPLSVPAIAEILAVKRRKVEAFVRGTRGYLRPTEAGVEFMAPQIGEHLRGAGAVRLDESVLHGAVRRFVGYLSGTADERLLDYRLAHVAEHLALLPNAERCAGLASWLRSASFREKVGRATADKPPAADIRLYLQGGGDAAAIEDLVGTFLRAEGEGLLVQTLLTLRDLPEVDYPGLEPVLGRLEEHASAWVRRSLVRLRRGRLNCQNRHAGKPRLVFMNYLGHLPFVLRHARADSTFALLLGETFNERLELAKNDQVEFLATTLDELALLSMHGVRYVPFYRIEHSCGADAIVLPAGSSVAGVEGLKGARIGFEANSISAVWLHQVLEDAGVSRVAVQERPFLAVEDCARALAAGALDAAVLWEPWVSAAGGRPLLLSGEPSQVINDILCVREEAAFRLVREAAELARTCHSFDANLLGDDQAQARRYFELTPEQIAQQLKALVPIRWEENLFLFGAGADEPAGVQRVARRVAQLEGLPLPFFDIEKSRQLLDRIGDLV